MNNLLTMTLATGLFVSAQLTYGHESNKATEEWHEECTIEDSYASCPSDAGDPRDNVENASYEDCVGDMQASWEGRECDWVRYMHPDYSYDDEYDEHELIAKVIIVFDPDEGVKPIVVIGDD